MRKLAIFATAMMLVALGIGGYFLWRDLELTRFASEPFGSNEAKVVEIQPGTGPKTVSEMLAQAGVVSRASNFYGFLRRERAAPPLRAGESEVGGQLAP